MLQNLKELGCSTRLKLHLFRYFQENLVVSDKQGKCFQQDAEDMEGR